VVEIANPLSEEASAMRTSLLPGMVDMLARNLNRGTEHARLFEYGHIYAMQGDATSERPALSIGLTSAAALAPESGAWLTPKSSPHSASDAAFFVLKGDLESLLSNYKESYFSKRRGSLLPSRTECAGITQRRTGRTSLEC